MLRRAAAVLAATGLATFPVVFPAALGAQTLGGATFTGAFATMTPGARCPSTGSIDFIAQGPADGEISGLFNDKGTLTLLFNRDTTTITVDKLTSQFEVNRAEAVGHLTWDRSDTKPLQITCDDLSMRIEGRVRYMVTRPFIAQGFAEIRISGSRRVITAPYYGNVVTTFLPAH